MIGLALGHEKASNSPALVNQLLATAASVARASRKMVENFITIP